MAHNKTQLVVWPFDLDLRGLCLGHEKTEISWTTDLVWILMKTLELNKV